MIILVLSDIYPFMGDPSNQNSEGLTTRIHDPDRASSRKIDVRRTKAKKRKKNWPAMRFLKINQLFAQASSLVPYLLFLCGTGNA